MHVNPTDVVTVVSAAVTLTVFVTGQVLHFKKTAAKIAAIGAVAVKEAPVVAEAAEAVAEVAK